MISMREEIEFMTSIYRPFLICLSIKKRPNSVWPFFRITIKVCFCFSGNYIIPPIPPPYPPPGGIAGAGGSSFGFSATKASVVSMSADTEAAF